MTEKEFDILQRAGINAGRAIERLMGKEHIFLKYLRRFADDRNCEDLMISLERNDYEEAFRAVHTLKGTAANVGAESVAAVADILTEALRSGNPSGMRQLRQNTDELLKAFRTARDAILRIVP